MLLEKWNPLVQLESSRRGWKWSSWLQVKTQSHTGKLDNLLHDDDDDDDDDDDGDDAFDSSEIVW